MKKTVICLISVHFQMYSKISKIFFPEKVEDSLFAILTQTRVVIKDLAVRDR